MSTTFPEIVTVQFGGGLSGQAANILMTVIDANGVTRIAATNNPGVSAFVEELDSYADAVTGAYSAVATFDAAWAYPLKAKFTITGQPGVCALSVYQVPPPNCVIDNTLSWTDSQALVLAVLMGNYAIVRNPSGYTVSITYYRQDGVTVIGTAVTTYTDFTLTLPVSRTFTMGTLP